jgi:hypothetical protein
LRFRPGGLKGQELRLRWNEIDSFFMGLFQTNPGTGGLAGAVTESQFRIVSDGNPTWIVATGKVANFPIFLEVLEKRFGVKIGK